ncbi:MAG: hypothetical protein LBR45_02265 [Bacteroidales bacterium]|jgi:microcystin-dependent protein|nr:hypothetical protein [Bacteroidales bacterium]
MKQKFTILAACILFALSNANAQVGINTLTPDTNVVLDIRHSSKGVLLPKLTSSVRTARKSLAPDGSLVYDATKKQLFFKDAGVADWVLLNPWRVEEGTAGNNIRLSTYENSRNVAIGYPASTAAKAKLDVNGKIRANDSLIGKTIKLDGTRVANMRKNGNNLHISSDGKIIFDKEINAASGAAVTGNTTVAGNVTVTGSVTVNNGNVTVGANNSFVGKGTIPVGGIILWSGSVTSLPNGWKLCDGTNGTPDLRGTFVVGYDNGKADYNGIGKKGGAETVTLNVNQMPNHNHKIGEGWYNNAANNSAAGKVVAYQRHSNMGNNAHVADMFAASAGGGTAHENRPPYYVLAYIMRIN